MMNIREERIGVIAALTHAVLWGMYPLIVHRATQIAPPLLFASISVLLGACILLLYSAVRKTLKELSNKYAYRSLFFVTLYIVIIPVTLIVLGAGRTSGLNTSMLLLSEIPFTLMVTHFIGERTTLLKLLGAGGVLIGAFLLLFQGGARPGVGDVLIIMGTATYPLGNFYAKKALHLVSPATVLLVRSFFGAIFILALSFLFERPHSPFALVKPVWPLVVLYGVVLTAVAKIIWYEGMKRIDISKIIALGMSFPFFSVLYLLIFFGEHISVQQWIGIAVMATGVYFSVKRQSVDPKLTKYAVGA